jgi:DNA-binding transcriptional ArsR family regulator
MDHRTMSPELVAELAERFKVLGEPARLQLLVVLREGERSVSELVEATGLGQANVSKHLQQLWSTGFVTRHKRGIFAYYALAGDHIFAICDVMAARIEAEHRDRRAASEPGK